MGHPDPPKNIGTMREDELKQARLQNARDPMIQAEWHYRQTAKLIAAQEEHARQEAEKAEAAAAKRHSEAIKHDRDLHRKTQLVAWISAGLAAIGIAVSVVSCPANKQPPAHPDSLSPSAASTLRPQPASVPASMTALTPFLLTNAATATTSTPPPLSPPP